jgi:hypothetical protein
LNGRILLRSRLLKHIIERKIDGKGEVKGRRGKKTQRATG